ncbi:MAG: PAS domain-containing protein [Phenylobacterium sp.]|uniref:PAS domain-containing protein n=1 Tax=Phenylobacterium sp. TaxID=1871053 RepID=UPI0027367E97|nr:PAS domain-containing protein [Phenylobacterium sp.]MDP3175176.1 PAS domain-containing protein [Phenylobacterium sp.]
MSMFHSTTERLIDYWRSRSRAGESPARADVDPSEFADIISRVFILGRSASGVYPVRLAGDYLSELHGGDLRARNALSLWAEADRFRLRAALEEARLRPEPIVATCDVRADGAEMPMEVLFAPLTGVAGAQDRFLGLYQPLGFTAKLGGRLALEMKIRTIRSAGAANEEAPRLRLATLDGRRMA